MHHNLIDTENFHIDDEVLEESGPGDWWLVCLPGGDSYPISLAELRLFELMSRKLQLAMVRDDKRRSLYLKNGLASDSEPPEPEEEPDDDEEPLTRGTGQQGRKALASPTRYPDRPRPTRPPGHDQSG